MRAKRYQQVAERVRAMASSGALRDGDRIPSVRVMARQMRISVTTVVEGYRQLEDRGFIESRPQSGFYLRPRSLRDASSSVARATIPAPEAQPIELFTERVSISPWSEAILRAAGRRDLVPLGAGMPAPEFFPSSKLAASVRRVLRRRPVEVNRYCLPPGLDRLRSAIARHMLDAGCAADPDEIYITVGGSHALLLGLRAVTEPGDTVAVESPGYFGFFGMLSFLGLRALEIPTHPATGFSVEAFERLVKKGGTKVSCVLLSSSFSNPTGALMPEDAKERLAAFCARHRIPLLEDDAYGDLAFASPRPRALKAFAPAAVMYAGSLSKILAPGYRVGWLAAGRHRRDVGRCNLLSWASVGLPVQFAMAEFLSEGGMTRHLRQLRGRYRDSLALVQNAVCNYFPAGTQTGRPSGGHFLWVRLPGGRDSRRLAERAFVRGISIAPGVLFSSRGHYSDHLRLNCALPWNRRLQAALETLGALAGELAARKVVE